MALADSYATAGEYRQRVKSTDATQDGALEFALLTVSRYLDRALNHHTTGFAKDDTDVARVFETPQGVRPLDSGLSQWGIYTTADQRALEIDDLSAAPTTIKLDLDRDGVYEITLATTDYFLVPRNAPRFPDPEPYTGVMLAPNGTHAFWTPRTWVEITGKWGWPAVPQAIRDATIDLTAILLLHSPRATSTVNEAGTVLGTSQEAQQIIRNIAEQYRKNAVYF